MLRAAPCDSPVQDGQWCSGKFCRFLGSQQHSQGCGTFHAQEDLQKEVARQFALMADDTWRTLDARGTVEQLEVQVRACNVLVHAMSDR